MSVLIILQVTLLSMHLFSQNIGLIFDGSIDAYDLFLHAFSNEISETGDVSFPSVGGLIHLTAEEADEAIAELSNRREIDSIVAVGDISSQALSRATLSPSQSSIGIRFIAEHTVSSAGLSRVIFVSSNAREEIEKIEKQLPIEIEAILIDERIAPIASDLGIDGIDIIPVSTSKLPSDWSIDGSVYVYSLYHLTSEELSGFFRQLSDRGIPAITSDGRNSVENGALAGYKSDLNRRLAREVALAIDELAIGTSISTNRTKVSPVSKLYINAKTLLNLEISLPWSVVISAEIVGSQLSQQTMPTLTKVIEEALDGNAELAAQQNAGESQKYTARSALSAVLPKVDANLKYVKIDEDRAEGVGSPNEHEASVGLRFEQVLWSEQAWANLKVQRLLSSTQDSVTLAKRADTALEAAEAYYDMARASSLVKIRRDTIERTQANFERARLQARVGEESLANVYRFESQLAQDNQALIDAIIQYRAASLELNRVRGLEGNSELMNPVMIESVENQSGLEEIEAIMNLVSTVWGVSILEDFAVEKALSRSETLAASEQTVAIREREKLSAQTRFFSPTLSVFGEVNHTFYQGGAGGGEEIEIVPGVATLDTATLSNADETDWTFGAILSFPVYSGNERIANYKRAQSNLDQARNERFSTALYIEQIARITSTNLVAVYNKLDQSRSAERAAKLSLELVEDSYIQGAATSYELLDAQNNAAMASQQRGTITAEFQIAWARLLHITGWIDALVSPDRTNEFFEELRNAVEGM